MAQLTLISYYIVFTCIASGYPGGGGGGMSNPFDMGGASPPARGPAPGPGKNISSYSMNYLTI